MSADQPLHLSPEQRSYLDYFLDGGLPITIPTEKYLQDEEIYDTPPWKIEGRPLTDEMDEEVNADDMLDPEFKNYLVSGKLKRAIKAAMHRGDWAVSTMAALEVNEQRNALHAARLIVKAVQAKLKEKIDTMNKDAKSSSLNAISITNEILNEITKEFMDLSKVIRVEDGKIRRNIVDIV